MSNLNSGDFLLTTNDNIIEPPGEHLAKELLARGIPQDRFASLIGLRAREFQEILAGTRRIKPALAAAIALQLGTSAELWLGLEARYREGMGKV